MSKLKNKITKELKSPIENELVFDTSKLEDNPKRKPSFKKVVGCVSLALASCIVIAIAIPLASAFFKVESNYKEYTKVYSIHEFKRIQESSFKCLNEIPNRNSNFAQKNEIKVSNEYVENVNNFANTIYRNIDKTNNISFSPYGLYSMLSIASLASNNNETLEALDSLLGMNKESRKDDFIKVYDKDYFVKDNCTLQFYNAAFMNNKNEVNPDYVNALTNYMVEAFQLDFSNDRDVSKMLSWIDQRMNETNYLTPNDIEIDNNSVMYLFSTMFFDSKWYHTFNTSNTYNDPFYTKNGIIDDVMYMSHSYMGECYDYEDYISCYDYYSGNIKIKYIVPKNTIDKSIYELIGNNNIFVDDESRRIVPEDEYYEDVVIDLSAPKFDNDCMVDFKNTLCNVGLSKMFNRDAKSFNYAFKNLKQEDSIYLSCIKQKNKVSFTEDGTQVKSVTIGGFSKDAQGQPMMANTIDVKLDRPFIYIIYDSNDIPIYVGNMDNPLM